MTCSRRWRCIILPPAVSIIFIIGLISALFPSADGALTALTSSFCIDLLDIKNRPGMDERAKRRTRMTVHVCFAVVFLLCILVFKWVNNKSTINIILDLAAYTYGPLLGLFPSGSSRNATLPNTWADHRDLSAGASNLLVDSAIIPRQRPAGFQIGIELLLLNGILTFLGLFLLSRRGESQV
jgi:hypothetical protein